VLFYSDGLIEAHNASREMFGVPRLKQLLNDMPDDSPLIPSLLEWWQDFRGDNLEQEDDMTLVMLHRATEDGPIATRDSRISVSIQSVPEFAGLR
jgi:serine phosphatase RsbU (regulator of sigma subunit)